MASYETISFLSDYGRVDEHVGIVHSVIRSIAPHVAVIDLTHDVAPYDVRGAGLLLARAAQYLCTGIVLAVVDPGGADRRAIAVEVGGGQSILVGPDNGLLAPAVALVGGADRAVELTSPAYRLDTPAALLSGRDVFAPAAAHLCAGVPLEELGPRIDPLTLRPALLSLSREENGGVEGDVLWVDRFGNVELNIDPDEITAFGDRVVVRIGDRLRTARRVTHAAELKTGELGLLVDAYGLVGLVEDRASAAEDLRVDVGDGVRLEPTEDDDTPAGAVSPVQLSARRSPPSVPAATDGAAR